MNRTKHGTERGEFEIRNQKSEGFEAGVSEWIPEAVRLRRTKHFEFLISNFEFFQRLP
jgi:hypothetical protein